MGLKADARGVLNFNKKGILLEQAKNVIRLTKSLGLKVKCFFIWGLPNETRDSVRETANFIKSLNTDDISITFFTPYPGLQIWPRIKSYGDVDEDWNKMSCFEIVFKPHGLTKEYLAGTRKQALMDFYLNPRIIFSYIKRIKSWRQAQALILSAYYLFRYIFTN